MATPALVGTAYEGSGSSVAAVTVTLTGSGITNGNSVIVVLHMATAITRTFTITDSAGNPWPAATVYYNPGRAVGIWYLPVATGLSGGSATITATISATTASFSLTIQETTPVYSPGLTDTVSDAVSDNHTSGATGLTTAGDVLVIAAGRLSAAATTTVKGAAYTRLDTANASQLAQALVSATGLTTEVGAWTSTGTDRTNDGCMAAFYDASSPTRLYLDSTATPAISPTYGGGWNSTAVAIRRRLNRTRQSSAMTTTTAVTSTATAPEFHLVAQYILTGLSAQTLKGFVRGEIRASESSVNLNGTVAVRLAKCDSAGANVVELLAVQANTYNAATPPELSTSLFSRTFSGTTAGPSNVSPIPFADATIAAGDALIVEIGVRDNDAGTSTASLSIGDDSGTDLSDNGNSSTANNPWIEFSAAIAVTSESAALTGTAVGGIPETDVVAGGKTIIITLDGDTFISN
jgi:hypothetical protein